MTQITQLPDSDDNLPQVKLSKMINEAIYNSGLELSPIDIVGVLEMCKHEYMFGQSCELEGWYEDA